MKFKLLKGTYLQSFQVFPELGIKWYDWDFDKSFAVWTGWLCWWVEIVIQLGEPTTKR